VSVIRCGMLILAVACGASPKVTPSCEYHGGAEFRGDYVSKGEGNKSPKQAGPPTESHSTKPTPLTDKDTILLASFTNHTGIEVLDGTLDAVLRTALEESPFLSVLSEASVAAALNDIARPAGTPLTPELARSVCLRRRSKAYVTGSINRDGSEFLVALQAWDCQSGRILADQQSPAQDKEKILDALGEAISEVRMQLGEPVESVRTFNTPLSRATSGSFEALRAWNAGIRAKQERGDGAALPFFESAAQLDPNFASALFSIGVIYRNTSQEGRAREFDTKAFVQRDRGSVRDRFRIAGLHYSFVTVEYAKAVETYREWAKAYPRDEKAIMGLGSFYGDVCRYGEAVAQFTKARRMDPNDVIAHDDLIEMLMATGQFAKVREASLEMQRLRLDDDTPHIFMYSVSVLVGDTKEMDQQAGWFAGRPQFQHELLSEQADAEAYNGHLARGRTLTKQAVESALRADNKEQAAAWQLNSAWREDLFGNTKEAREQALRALEIAPDSREESAVAAILLARTGDTARANSIAKDLDQRYPVHAVVQAYWLPCIRAQISLANKQPASALQQLERARPYDTLFPQVAYYSPMLSVVLRAEAYLALGQLAAAAKEWDIVSQHPGITQLSATAPISKLQLARASALQARSSDSSARAKARVAYQEFLSLWKDADPDIPALKDAKAEFAKLE